MVDKFTYKEISGFITQEDNATLTEELDKVWVKNNINSKEFFLKNGHTLESAEEYIKELGIEYAHMCYSPTYIVQQEELSEQSKEILFRLRNKLKANLQKETYGINKPGRWHTMLNISLTHPYAGLRPHTDNPQTLVERNPNHLPAYIKGLIYLGDTTKSYSGFGTRLYTGENVETEFKEILFVPTNGLLFVPNKNSYHGTVFTDNEIKKRYSIVFEYVLIEDIERSEKV